MAFLFHRLRTILTFTNPSPSLSLLHHHRHRHLSSTSNSASHFASRILTPPSLLRHHHRLLSSISGDHLSPYLLTEVREAIKQLHASAYVYQSGPAPSTFKPNPASSPFSSALSLNFNSNSDEEPDQNDSTSTLDDKFERLKLKALSLNQRKETDNDRFMELIDSRTALSTEIVECINLMEKNRRRRNTGKPPPHEIDTLIMEHTRLREMTVEIVELSKVLTESRLASFYEMIRNLSRIRKDLHLQQQQGDNEEFEKILNELREGLMRGVRLEVIQFKVLVKEMGDQAAHIEQCISHYFHVRDSCSCTAYEVGPCRHALGNR